MSNLVKYGVGGKRMMSDASAGARINASMNVPKKFLETEGRKKFQKFVNILGRALFGVTITIVAVILLFMVFPSLLPESLSELKASLVIIPLFLINLIGMFISSASDGVGANWCARGIALMFLILGIGFIATSLLSS